MLRNTLLKESYIITILGAGALILCYPLVFKGYLRGHDIGAHLSWAQQFLNSLRSGHLYPQWAPHMNFGCGSATFIFYPPLTFFIYAGIGLFTKDILTILNISVFLGIMTSGLTIYLFCRTFLTRFPSLLSALSYMALPYHLIDIYQRSALAESWAFPFIPLICFFAAKMVRKALPHFVGLSLSYTGLILTHLPTALLFTPFLLSYIGILLYREKDMRLLYSRLLALGLGLGLACFYLIPAIAEQQFVNIAKLTKPEKFWVETNFLFSRSGGDSPFVRTMSLVALSTSLIPAINLLLTVRPRGKSYGNFPSYDSFFAVAGLVSFLLMLPVSRIVWSALPLLKQVQFPWRLLSITTFFASICVGILIKRISDSSLSLGRQTKVLIGYLLFASLAVNSWHSYTVIRSAPTLPIEHVRALREKKVSILSDDSSYRELERKYNLYFNGQGLWFMDVGEYRPFWSLQPITDDHIPPMTEDEKKRVTEGYRALIKKRISESPDYDFASDASVYYDKHGSYVLFPPMKLLRSIDATDIVIRIPYEMLKESVFFKKGRGEASVMIWDAEERVIRVEAAEPSDLLIKTFYYPRWKAYREGVPLPTSADPDTGLIEIQIPSGSYKIDLRFEAGVYRIFGIAIAVCSMAILLLLLVIWFITRANLQESSSLVV